MSARGALEAEGWTTSVRELGKQRDRNGRYAEQSLLIARRDGKIIEGISGYDAGKSEEDIWQAMVDQARAR